MGKKNIHTIFIAELRTKVQPMRAIILTIVCYGRWKMVPMKFVRKNCSSLVFFFTICLEIFYVWLFVFPCDRLQWHWTYVSVPKASFIKHNLTKLFKISYLHYVFIPFSVTDVTSPNKQNNFTIAFDAYFTKYWSLLLSTTEVNESKLFSLSKPNGVNDKVNLAALYTTFCYNHTHRSISKSKLKSATKGNDSIEIV